MTPTWPRKWHPRFFFFAFFAIENEFKYQFYSVFWKSTKICPKMGHKTITFHILQTQVIKTVLLQPPISPKIGIL